MSRARQYFSMFRMRFISGLQYRAAAWAGIATQFAWGGMLIMIYTAFYASSSTPPPMELSQLCTYIWLQQAFFALVAAYAQDGALMDSITTGQVAYELCRPYDLYGFWYARLLAGRLSSVLLRCLPVLVFALILPEPYGLSLPANPAALALFLCALGLTALLITGLSMFVYWATFLTLSPRGTGTLFAIAMNFLAGNTIPLPLMPASIQRVLYWMPFRYTADLTFRIYSGHIPPGEAIVGILMQMGWIVALVTLGAFCFSTVKKRIVIQGG